MQSNRNNIWTFVFQCIQLHFVWYWYFVGPQIFFFLWNSHWLRLCRVPLSAPLITTSSPEGLVGLSGKSPLPVGPAPPLVTLPAVVADAQLLARQVAVAAVGAAAVVPAVGDVAGLALPVVLALAVHPARHRVSRTAPAVAGAVVGTRVYSEMRAKKKKKKSGKFCKDCRSRGTSDCKCIIIIRQCRLWIMTLYWMLQLDSLSAFFIHLSPLAS